MFFTIEKIQHHLKEVQATIYRQVIPIPCFKFHEGDCPGAERLDFDDRDWPVFEVGGHWGGYDVTAWFRAWVEVPSGWTDRKLRLRLLAGPRNGGGSTAEALLYIDGSPLQGIDIWHSDAWLPPEALETGRFLVALKAWSGVLEIPPQRRFAEASLAWVDEGAERFYFLADTLIKAVQTMDECDLRRIQILGAVNEAFRQVDFLVPRSEAYYRSLEQAGNVLRVQVAAWQGVEEIKPRVTATGHAHIDMAWLWRLKDTREKAARTFSTALHLMRQYPEYRYMHSSPALYQYLKQDYPEIYAQVKEKIASGQWEVTGGMWVEADTNLTSGESLVRQLLLGKRFVREEFGQEMRVLWMPDVFGYSAALPQILRKSGMTSFLTTKISWNQFNRFPYDTFRWRGLDGSEILTHFVTTPEESEPFFTYNGLLTPKEVQGIWKNYQQKEINSELLLLFGWGDGGGGPTREMLETGRALSNLPGIPRVDFGRAEPYFERLAETTQKQDLPVWDGELYFELHRGTYTSQARAKRLNRKAEILYHDAEFLCALADVLTGSSSYPAEALRAGWEKILLNQFHDILPGSSIRQVYEDMRADHAGIAETGEAAIATAQETLAALAGLPAGGLMVFNTLPWDRTDLVEVDIVDVPDGAAQQPVETEAGRRALIAVKDIPGMGYRTISRDGNDQAVISRPEWQTQPVPVRSLGGESLPDSDLNAQRPLQLSEAGSKDEKDEIRVGPQFLENAWYRIDLNPAGQIANLWDKQNGRQVLPPGGRANMLQAFEDKPMRFDAWDIDIYYKEKGVEITGLEEACVEEAGPLRGTLRLRWRFSSSTITQRLSLYRHSPRIDFRTEVDWHEHQVLLKAAFPVAVRSTRATYEIQFGSLERPTHWNTSWDWARFEVVGHKWADLSEGNYGVALLNDCKYGYDIKDNVMRLTLIKSALEPDETADQGLHEFTYSLLPHTGDWRQGGVIQEAHALNTPLRWARLPKQAGIPRLAGGQFGRVEGKGVVLDTIKRAEDGDGWIVRVHESHQNSVNPVRLGFGRPLRKAEACSLMEEAAEPVQWDPQGLTFAIAPFEIKTFRVWFA